MKNKELQKFSDDIISILSELKNKREIFNFLRDLLTEKEIIEFSRRFQVAKMLEEKVVYSEIEDKTKMSSTTIARISKFLNWDNFWYKNAIKVLKSISDKHHTAHQT